MNDDGYSALDVLVKIDGESMSLRSAIEKIPEDGWWKTYSRDTYWDAAKAMLKHGVPAQDTVEMLYSLYSAAAACYGN